MAKLPYTYTICPDGPEPQRFTASCAAMGAALTYGCDLTIDQRKDWMFQKPSKTNLEVVKPIKEKNE